MKLAIVSTTIQGEKGYLPFDKLAARSKFSDVTFFIAGDTSSVPFATNKFECNIEHLTPKDQERFAISDIIGWCTSRRRPVAYLRAIETDPDFILTIDDDNIPPNDYFDKWYEAVTTTKNQIAVLGEHAKHSWLNYLRTSDAQLTVYPRGFPLVFRGLNVISIVQSPVPIKPEEIGIFQGISLQDPDIEAMTKIISEEPVRITTIAEKNYCLKDVWAPYNTQNTILTKKLFPLPLLWPLNGRFDDIYASYAYQQFLFNNDLYAHIGDAVNHQDRGVRDIFNADFKLEIDGYLESHKVWKQITTIAEKDGIEFLKKLIELPHPQIAREKSFFEAYLQDVGKILG